MPIGAGFIRRWGSQRRRGSGRRRGLVEDSAAKEAWFGDEGGAMRGGGALVTKERLAVG